MIPRDVLHLCCLLCANSPMLFIIIHGGINKELYRSIGFIDFSIMNVLNSFKDYEICIISGEHYRKLIVLTVKMDLLTRKWGVKDRWKTQGTSIKSLIYYFQKYI